MHTGYALTVSSLALLDHFFLFVFGSKKGSGEQPIPFCSANPHYLGVDNWPLMASDKRQRAECI